MLRAPGRPAAAAPQRRGIRALLALALPIAVGLLGEAATTVDFARLALPSVDPAQAQVDTVCEQNTYIPVTGSTTITKTTDSETGFTNYATTYVTNPSSDLFSGKDCAPGANQQCGGRGKCVSPGICVCDRFYEGNCCQTKLPEVLFESEGALSVGGLAGVVLGPLIALPVLTAVLIVYMVKQDCF